MNQEPLSDFCAEQSRQTAEPIYGTAPAETTVWLLLEYNLPWGPKAVENNDLPAPVQSWLDQQLQSIPQSRLVFIKQASGSLERINFYLALADETEQRLHHLTLSAYEDLLELDLTPYLNGSPAAASDLVDEPLFLVCTNGKRDRCCTKFGLPLYNQLSQTADPNQVWQSSHLGGHRWAPVAAVMPQGVYYRILDPQQETERLLQAAKNNTIVLDGYRGRNCYSGPVQAADYFVRKQTGDTQLDHLRLSESCLEGEIWKITFVETTGGKKHVVQLVVEEDNPVLVGCTMGKSKVEPGFQLISYHAG